MAKRVVSRKKNHVTAFRDPVFAVEGAVVYFIGTAANNLVKVGYSDRFRPRFMQIASTSPVPVMALGVLRFSGSEAARKAESAIHTMLTKAGRHSHGEWFRLPISGVASLAARFAEMGIQYLAANSGTTSVVLDTEADMPDIYTRTAAPRYEIAV